MNGTEFRTKFQSVFPEDAAYDWDNVGLQIGTLNKEVKTILLTLDVTKTVVQEAIDKNVDLIVAHHPLIFRPISNVNTDTTYGEIIRLLIKHDITLYVAHTNFDVTPKGMNVILAELLQLNNLHPLKQETEEYSLGVIGELSEKIDTGQYIERLKEQLQIPNLTVIGDHSKKIKYVALTGGSGSSVIHDAINSNADLLITGDVTYHHALDVIANDFLVLDVGHNIEKQSLPGMKKVLEKHGVDATILISEIDTNPYIVK